MLPAQIQEIRRLYHIHVCEDVHGNQRLPLEAGVGLGRPGSQRFYKAHVSCTLQISPF